MTPGKKVICVLEQPTGDPQVVQDLAAVGVEKVYLITTDRGPPAPGCQVRCFRSAAECAQRLRRKKYYIICATGHISPENYQLYEYEFYNSWRTAIVFSNGQSEMRQYAVANVYFPLLKNVGMFIGIIIHAVLSERRRYKRDIARVAQLEATRSLQPTIY